MRTLLMFLGLVASAAVIPAGAAERYPSRPVRLVLPFAPGGGADISARMIAQKLTERLGQQVVVDNRPGAGGTVGTELVLKAPPDGYTLLVVSSSYGANPALYKLDFDPVRAFQPITLVSRQPFLLAVYPGLPVRTVQELVAYARANPRKLNYVSSGIGGIQHLATELFKSMTKVDIVHVPYKGGSSGVNDLIAGQVHMVFGTVLSTLPMVRNGQLRGLAVSTLARSPAAPDLPTVAESGVPGFDVSGWYAVLAPGGTPKDITAVLNREIVALLRAPEVSARYAKDGSMVVASTPGELVSHLRREIERWQKLVREAHITLERSR